MAITTLQREALVELYVAILDRAPLKAGLDFWSDVFLGNGDDLIYTATEMWKSDGAQSVYGSSTPVEDLVETVFQHVFGRAPLQGGKDFWVAEWNANVTLYGDDEGAARTMLQMIDNVKNNPGANPDDKAIFENKVEFGDWFSKQGIDDPALAAAGFAQITPAASSIAAAQAFVDTDPAETVILTSLTNVETTGNNDDNFLATNATLNTSDKLDGGAGYDVLSVDVETSSGFNTAPTLSNIEKISVTVGGSNTNNGTIDLSRASGYEVLEVFQNERLYFTWADIQDVNDTELSIIDTYSDGGSVINYIYDTNAYEAGAGIDTARLTVAEVGNLGVQNSTSGVTAQVGPIVNLLNETPNGSSSNVDAVDLQSLWNGQVNDTTGNYIYDLNVGSQFRTLMIGGNDAGALGLPESTTNTDGNLEIERFLDASVRLVDATELAANLTLDLIGNSGQNGDATQGVLNVAQGGTDTGLGRTFSESITVLGAQGNDLISVSGSTNGLFELGNGADTLNVGSSTDLIDNDILDQNVQGHLIVKTGANNDVVRANITGIQNIDLGTGNDSLTLVGDVDNRLTSIYADGISTINAGDGADTVTLSAYALHLAPAKDKADNDYLIDLGTGSDLLTINGAGDQSITAGDGADSVTLNGFGHNNITGGEGADSITINGDGNQTIDSGTEDDKVFINGDGAHTVQLGDGDDLLHIDGDRIITGFEDVVDNTVADILTVIDAGQGDDTVIVDEDHYLDVELGTGNDVIQLRARDLTADDGIDGGDGVDTMILTNTNCDKVAGEVNISDTSSTQGIERFHLNDGGISLVLTAELFDTAEDHDIVVNTEAAEQLTLPQLKLVNVADPLKTSSAQALTADLANLKDNADIDVFEQGMKREDWESLLERWEDGEFVETHMVTDNYAPGVVTVYANTQAGLIEFLLDNGVDAVDFDDTTPDGDGSYVTDAADTVLVGDDEDQVFFVMNGDCDTTVDVTNTPLTVVNERNFTLEGGTIRDIVIADEGSMNGRMTLRFDSAGGDNESTEDTLIIRGAAELTSADLRNVSGLENIILESKSNNVGESWTIQLTDRVIEQTTGNAPLVITVDADVPAGSVLNIVTDATTNGSNNGVIINSNSNVKIIIDGYEVKEQDIIDGKLFGEGGVVVNGPIAVGTPLVFTQNDDSLIGSSGVNDTFVAYDADDIDDSDSAEGGSNDEDTLLVHDAVSNQNKSLEFQFDGAQLDDIEVITFNTNNNVQMTGVADDNAWLATLGLQTLNTGAGNDTLLGMEAGIHYHTHDGDDSVSLDGNTGTYYVAGGDGDDTVSGSNASQYMFVSHVESVYGNGGNDTIDYNYTGSNDEDIFVDGGTGLDYLRLDQDGTNGVATVTDVESIFGGDGEDTIVATAGSEYNYVSVYGDGDGWNGDGADSIGAADDITVTDANDVYVDGEQGDDVISVGNHIDNVNFFDIYDSTVVNAYVYGGAGSDQIDVTVSNWALVYGDSGEGNDTINTNAWYSWVYGQGGNDLITSTAEYYAGVEGGDGADTITVDGGDYGYAYGDDGDDIINVTGDYFAEAIGGDGNDVIDATSAFGGVYAVGGNGNDAIALGGTNGIDYVEFGNVFYDLQQDANLPTQNTQGMDVITDFNFETNLNNPNIPAPFNQDMMDFTDFIGANIAEANRITVQGNWAGAPVNAAGVGGNSIVVLSAPNGTLDPTDFGVGANGGPIKLNDNGKAVVVVGVDATGIGSGIKTFHVYYVQDVDTGVQGQNWKVDKVATVTADTAIGIETVMDNLLAGIDLDEVGDVKEDGPIVDNGELQSTDNVVADFVDENIVGTYGTLDMDADGTWTYTLNNAANNVQSLNQGETVYDSFTVTLTDNSQRELTIAIDGTNDAPVITNNLGVVDGDVVEDGDQTANGDANASDVDSSAVLAWSAEGSDADAIYTATEVGTYGTLTINSSTGVWSYALNNNAANVQALDNTDPAVTDTFNVRVVDQFGASASQNLVITIDGTNDAPVATAININAIEDAANVVTAINPATDVDVEPLAYTLQGNSASADVRFHGQTSANLGLTINAATGAVTLAPTAAIYDQLDAGEVISFTYTYGASDGDLSDTDTITVTVTGIEDGPTLTVNTALIDGNSINLTAFDIDGDFLTLVDDINGDESIANDNLGGKDFAVQAQASVVVIDLEVTDGTLIGDSGYTLVQGTDGDDILAPVADNGIYYGFDGNDDITGGNGNDIIFGGLQRDVMAGGAGADVFAYSSFNESQTTFGNQDLISDFTTGVDKIDLSAAIASTNATITDLGGFGSYGAGVTAADTAMDANNGVVLFTFQWAGNNFLVVDANLDGISPDMVIGLGANTIVSGDLIL